MLSSMQKTKINKKSAKRFQSRVTILSGAGMFIDGFDISVIAVALPGLKAAWNVKGGIIEGIITSSAIVGMFLGMLFGGYLADKFGRRKMYMIDLVGFVVFALLAAITQNVWQLIATRFLLGIFIGADYPISSSITAEFTAPQKRGRFIIFMSLLWQAGAFAAYITGIVMLPLGEHAWRYMLLVGAILAAIVLVMRSDVPESPRWLRSRGRVKEANDIMEALTAEQGSYFNLDSLKTAEKSNWHELFSARMVKQTIFCCSFWFAFAVSFYGIQMYTPSILQPFTQGSKAIGYLGSAIIALMGVLGAAIGMYTVEKFGRRKQIIWCFVGMIIAISIIAITKDPHLLAITILLSLAILLANLGPGVLNMVYPNELFPTRLRASGVGFAGSVSRVGAILGVTVFPTLVANWGVSNSTWIFAGVALFGLVISIWLAPETMGKSLEEIEELAENGWKTSKNKF